jgi:hypothetical protein
MVGEDPSIHFLCSALLRRSLFLQLCLQGIGRASQTALFATQPH